MAIYSTLHLTRSTPVNCVKGTFQPCDNYDTCQQLSEWNETKCADCLAEARAEEAAAAAAEAAADEQEASA